MPLSPFELTYKLIFLACMANPDPLSLTVWVDHSLDYGTSSHPFSRIFSTDESIMESMMLKEEPWLDSHHWSHHPGYIENSLTELYRSIVVDLFTNFISIHAFNSDRNLLNIEEMISINISTKPGIVENIHVDVSCSPLELESYCSLFREFHDVFSWSYEEMSGINTIIVEHIINMYLDVKPMCNDFVLFI